MKSTKVNTESKEVETEQLSIETVDEVSLAISHSRFAGLKSRELAIMGLALDANSARTFETVREKCKLYGRILNGKMWEQDGYKNFKDCAERLFGDKPGVAYMQAKAGARFYDDNASEIAAEIGKYLSWSVLDKLSPLNDAELIEHKADILKTGNDGKVIGGITQKDADDLAKRIVANRSQSTGNGNGGNGGEGDNGCKAEIVSMYDFKGYRIKYELKEGTDEVLPMVYTIDRKNVPSNSIDDVLKVDAKEHLFKFKEHSYRVSITEDGAIVVYEKREHVEPKSESTKSSMEEAQYDGIRAGRRNGVPADVVALMLGIEVDVVNRVYDSLDREEQVLQARAKQLEKSAV